jgi:ATP-dependent DNA ligase
MRRPRWCISRSICYLLHLDGEDLMRLPLLERKARLEALLGSPHDLFKTARHNPP